MGSVRLIQTARDTGDRLTEKTLDGFSEESDAQAGEAGEIEDAAVTTLALRPERKYQKIIGFGGAFTESAAYTFYRMEPEKRKDILRKYYDPDEGIGYSIGRVHINSCDFSLGNYTYVNENDAELASFDISHEEQWMIPMVREAEAARKGRIMLLASPWSPPGWMKSNGEMNHGGKLLPQYREVWARYLVNSANL